VSHGVGTHKGNDTVTVLASREHNRLRLEIRNVISSLDDGTDATQHRGVGLSSTRERLAQLYGTERSSLRLTNIQPAGVCAEILIPARVGPTHLAPPAEIPPCRSAH
jgi:two-component system, LytTR family, sensor kinase